MSRPAGKTAVRKGEKLLEGQPTNSGIGTVRPSEVNPDGSLTNDATIKIQEPLKEVTITPDKE